MQYQNILCAATNIRISLPAHAATGGSSGGGRSGGGSAVPPVMSMLGYGTPTALANDPRVNPRAWQHGHDVDADQEQLQPNCGVSSCCTDAGILGGQSRMMRGNMVHLVAGHGRGLASATTDARATGCPAIVCLKWIS